MRAHSFIFLAAGFGVGFAAMYPWMSKRAPEIARPIPTFVRNMGSPAEPPAPPLDTARMRQLEETVSKDPKNFDALIELGNMHFDQRAYDKAAGLYKKGLEVQPGNVTLRTDLGTALFYSRRVDEAIVELRKSLELDPTHPQTLFNLGVALLEGKNDSKGALEAWEKLVAANPDFPQIAIVKQQIDALRARQQ